MNKFNSVVFKKAHQLAKQTVQSGDNYRVTFAACLVAVREEMKAVSKVYKSKYFTPATNLWEQNGIVCVKFAYNELVIADFKKVMPKAKWNKFDRRWEIAPSMAKKAQQWVDAQVARQIAEENLQRAKVVDPKVTPEFAGGLLQAMFG